MLRRFSTCKKLLKISDNLKDYDVVINPDRKLLDIFMEKHGKTRHDFKLSDIATWQNSWGTNYKFGLFFPKNTLDLAFTFNTIQYKSIGYQPDFQQLGMAWIPPEFRGKEILKVVTDYLHQEEGMMRKNMLACNTQWSQNFWKQATGNGDIGFCTYYISYYDVEDLKLCDGVREEGIRVEKITPSNLLDVIDYDQKIFPFERSNWIFSLFTSGISRIAYNSDGATIGIGCLSIYPSGEVVISPLYADNMQVARNLFQSMLEELLHLNNSKSSKNSRKLWRIQVRSNDQCRNSFEWIEPFLSRPLYRIHLSNLCYSLYPPKYHFDFGKVFVNCHPTCGPC